METLKQWSSQHGYFIVVAFLTMASKGSTCEAPSPPQCYQTKIKDDKYICEWSMNTNASDVTFDLYFNETKKWSGKSTSTHFLAEDIKKRNPVDLWVRARTGDSVCTSTRRQVRMINAAVKFEAPHTISMSWIKNNLSLTWRAAGIHPVQAEVWFQRAEDPEASWENITTNSTVKDSWHQMIVVNLQKNSAYKVKIRHQSTQTPHVMWSDWSPVQNVPAELEAKLEVTVTNVTVFNGTREVTLIWKPVPRAAAIPEVTYLVEDTQSSRGCPCVKGTKRSIVRTEKYTTSVSYSAVNISVIARNTAGCSPPAVVQILPVEHAADVKTPCEKTLLDEKPKRHHCMEWYEHQNEDLRSKTEPTLTACGTNTNQEREKKSFKFCSGEDGEDEEEEEDEDEWEEDYDEEEDDDYGDGTSEPAMTVTGLEDHVRYLFFEHRCHGWKAHTVNMCLYYKKEGAPNKEPQDLTVSGETQSSANISWQAIPVEAQRGFLTHYRLCSQKISSQDEGRVCENITVPQIKHQNLWKSLENLSPDAKYNISLCGVTSQGEGPEAILIISTLPEKPVNVWWSLCPLSAFFLLSMMCSFMWKRMQNKIFPPVPRPVIQEFSSYSVETQEILERKEVVHELTLHQIHPEGKSLLEGLEETTILEGEWVEGDDCVGDLEDTSGGSDISGGTSGGRSSSRRRREEGDVTDVYQENEIALLVYRNGLVFDVKTD